MKECWLPVVAYEGLYEVSNLGRVRSLLPSKRFPAAGHILSPRRSGQGHYVCVGLYKNKKSTTITIHQLVMQAFVGSCPDGMNINHKDGRKKNNQFSNLEYVTFSANSRHAFTSGVLPQAPTLTGENNGNASLTESQAIEIAVRLHQGERACDIAKAMNASINSVYDIKRRRKWRHLFAVGAPLAHLAVA